MDLLTQDVLKELGVHPDQERILPPQLTFPSVSSYLPGWGLLYSFGVHVLVFCALFLLSVAYRGIGLPRLAPVAHGVDLRNPQQVIYLPTLGGGSHGTGSSGRTTTPPASLPGSSARSSKGFSYPGPQPVLSNPPRRTNPVQTILRPALEKPRVLQDFVPLPNLVQMAAAKPALPAALMAPPPALPAFHPAIAPPADPPKLVLPASPPSEALPPLTPEPPSTAAVTDPKPAEPASPDVAALPVREKDIENLVVLSATPAPPEPAQLLPAGETRGRFADFPQLGLRPLDTSPGSRSEGTPSESAIGNQPDAMGTDAAVEFASTAGSGGGQSQARAHGTMGGGTRGGDGSGGAGNGAGAARRSGTGSGTGEAPGNRMGSGSGAGSGPGRGVFPGITVQGGRLVPSMTAPSLGKALPPQTSYSLTIVSTGNSGGGLGDFGVFANEKVYTVYLDMRRTAGDPAPCWTLQYALLHAAPAAKSAAGRREDKLAPPFLVVMHLPKLPVELVNRYQQRLVVVYAVLDEEGKLGSVAVRQSPDARLITPLLDVLQRWVFRPAELNGHPVPIKVLLGIPLSPFSG